MAMADKMIWAPWRTGFVLGKKEEGCVFCNRLRQKDSERNLILARRKHVFVILNKFPYNSGHVMVVPLRHVGQLEKLTAAESNELFEMTRISVSVIKKALKPNGFNLGMNLGRMAGAGIPGHVHMHIVPRFQGDTNFMPIVGKTEVNSIPLGPIYVSLKKGFESR